MLQARLCFWVVVAVVALANESYAQSNRQLLREIDTNRDGLIQFTELQVLRARMFDQIDLNGNGIADPTELNTLRDTIQKNRRSANMSADPSFADTNYDGVITRSEFIAGIPPRLLSADRNGDGALSRSELRTLR